MTGPISYSTSKCHLHVAQLIIPKLYVKNALFLNVYSLLSVMSVLISKFELSQMTSSQSPFVSMRTQIPVPYNKHQIQSIHAHTNQFSMSIVHTL